MGHDTAAGWPPGMQMVAAEDACPRALLRPPNGYGYLHVAAEVERPGPLKPHGEVRKALGREVLEASARLAELPGVQRADVFDAVLIPPGTKASLNTLAALGHPDVRPAAYDLVLLVECASVERATELRDGPVVGALLERLRVTARKVTVTVADNGRRIDEVDKGRQGVFLFNYFWSVHADREIAQSVWEYTAGWFTAKGNLDNSTLMRPTDPERSEYIVLNHCRWDTFVDIVPHLALRPTLKRFVLANFTANGMVAMPILYRLAGRAGRPVRRPTTSRLTQLLGLVHTLATIPPLLEVLPYITSRGLFGGISNAVPPPPEAMPALAVLFSLIVGALLFVVGGLLVPRERDGHRFPIWLGPTFLGIGLVGGLLVPPTGFWFVAALGAWWTWRRP